MTDAIDIVNRALSGIGMEPISLSDEFAGTKAQLLYDTTVSFCIGLGTFSFAQEMRALTRLNATSAFGLTYVYQLPADALGPPLRISNDATALFPEFSRYVLSGDQAHADADALYALIKFRPAPSKWPATFAEAVRLALAAELAYAFADDDKARQALRIDAFGFPQDDYRGGALGAAIREDSRATPPRRLPFGSNPFLAGR
jgi:hypothetical protein